MLRFPSRSGRSADAPPPLRLLAAGFLLMTAAVVRGAAPPADLSETWRLGVQARFDEAASRIPADTNDEEARFTRAVLRFNGQPRTAAKMDEAVAQLADLAEKAETRAVRARSLYFWARAVDLRETETSSVLAAKLYERLWQDYPDQSWGQRALVHGLLLAFYAKGPRAVVLARCAELAAQSARLTDPTVQGHFHQVAARGYLHLGGAEALALSHLLAAERLGVARLESRADLQVSIGQVAAELAQPEVAREHYAAFLRQFPHDPRVYTVRALLAALPPDGGTKP